MTIEAVLFDVGNTLLNVPEDPHKRALRRVAQLGSVNLAAYRAGLAQAQREWREAGGAPDIEDLAATWVGHITRALQLSGFAGDCSLAARLIEASFLEDGWEVFPEVCAVLDEIARQGVRMGIVSNWPATLEATLRAAGLEDYFDVVVVSGVVGYAKPHPQIFRLALDQLGLAPSRALFVGDSLEEDVRGSEALGMPSVLIDRQRRFVDEHRGRIDSLHELLDLMPSLEKVECYRTS